MAKNPSTADLNADERADRAAAAPAAKRMSGELVTIRVTFKGHDEIFTGQLDGLEPARHPKGAIVPGIDRVIAEELQDRGFAEIQDEDEA